MPSTLVGLKRVLTWSDFGTPVKKAPPAPGKTATAAFTFAQYGSKGIGGEVVPGSKPAAYRLRDNVTMTVQFAKAKSWVADWVFKQSATFQKDLLKHEQGHYLVAAFLGRDHFIDLMQLKAGHFSSSGKFTTALNAVNARYKGKSKAIHQAYDDDTNSGLVPGQQARWDGFFRNAFTKPRTPEQYAPDGMLYKLPLLEVLAAGGVSL